MGQAHCEVSSWAVSCHSTCPEGSQDRNHNPPAAPSSTVRHSQAEEPRSRPEEFRKGGSLTQSRERGHSPGEGNASSTSESSRLEAAAELASLGGSPRGQLYMWTSVGSVGLILVSTAAGAAEGLWTKFSLSGLRSSERISHCVANEGRSISSSGPYAQVV